MEKTFETLFLVLLLILLISFASLFLAFPIKWCWNHTMPYLFEFKTIQWSHAWCLSFLSSMLIQSSISHNSSS